MSSNKLFNKNYAIQNLKKSKGILIIMLIIIPIITLFCLYNQDNSRYAEPCEMAILIIANLIGACIIPFILSNILLGYVYKKSSVDFVNSMPITRKKIYLTNIITGFLYIILLQLINFIVLAIYLFIAKNPLTLMGMLIDSTIVMTFTYLFMFALSSFALAISGNKFIQVVLIMLLLFLIPFMRIITFEEVFGRANIIFENNTSYVNGFRFDENSIFLLPINIVYSLTIQNSIYDVYSILGTVAFTIFYVIVGMKLFEKRKMENTGSSFESIKTHLIVKALTLYPMISLLKIVLRSLRLPEIVLIIFLIFVYYFVYDLITIKKVKLKTTILSFIASSAILFIIISGLSAINEKITDVEKKFARDDVKSVELEINSLFNTYYYSKASIAIEDEKIVNLILDEINDDMDKMGIRVTLKLKLKNNQNIEATAFLDEYTSNKILEYINKDKNKIKTLANFYKSKGDMIVTLNTFSYGNINLKGYKDLQININNSLEKYFDKEVEDYIENYFISQSNDMMYNSEYYSRNYITIYSYKNHEIVSLKMDLDNLPEIEKEILKIVNEKARNKVIEIEKDKNSFSYNTSFTFIKKMKAEEDSQNYYINVEDTKKIFKFIKENYKEEVDPERDYYEIECNNFSFTFYTNEIEKIEEIIKKYEGKNLFDYDIETIDAKGIVQNL